MEMSQDTNGLGKLDPLLKGRLTKRAYVQGADMQIHVPTTREPSQLDETYTFKNVLGRYLSAVNTLQNDADAQIQRLIAGETEDLHEVTLAMDEAETSFELLMEIRNKLVEAYNELKRMQ